MADKRRHVINVNALPVREAMGLPPHVVCRTDNVPLARHPDLRFKSPEELAVTAEDGGEEFSRRYAAGLLLGLLGDPRTSLTDPVMISLAGGRVRCGLDYDDLDTVVERWSSVGVQRRWIAKECPRHEIALRPFRMAKYLVTNGEYYHFLERSKLSQLPTSWCFGTFPSHLSNHPVWTVSPQAADAYAKWLAKTTGRQFRLPTEAEWEYAAGGTDAREYPWGNDFDPWQANTVEAGPLQTTPIGIYPQGASPFGMLDMAGNVEELVADCYAPYPGGEPIGDDLGTVGSYRVTRGGSFTRYGDLARCRRRHGWYDGKLYAIGFRLAEDI